MSQIYNIKCLVKRTMSWSFTLKPIGSLDEIITGAT